MDLHASGSRIWLADSPINSPRRAEAVSVSALSYGGWGAASGNTVRTQSTCGRVNRLKRFRNQHATATDVTRHKSANGVAMRSKQ